MKRTLIIVRHAKSSWVDQNLSDYQRPLNQRGLNDAPFMAKVMSEAEAKPDRIISSGALRALTTANEYAKAFGMNSSDVQVDDKIYEASVADLIEVINTFDDSWERVLIFGHNPGFSYLTQYLCGEMVQLPTNGVVCMEIELDSWEHLGHGCADMKYHDYPKQHKRS